MGKVKLTQENADLLENKRKKMEDYKIIEVFSKVNGERNAKFHIDELIKALYIGYEVEPEFKVGDLVFVDWDNRKGGKFYVVEYVSTDGSVAIDNSAGNNRPCMDIIRHATPEEIAEEKERRWWAKHNRDVWEMKDRDLLINITTGKICTVRVEHNDLHLAKADNVILSIYDPKKLAGKYEVICFAEDRKDVTHEQEIIF